MSAAKIDPRDADDATVYAVLRNGKTTPAERKRWMAERNRRGLKPLPRSSSKTAAAAADERPTIRQRSSSNESEYHRRRQAAAERRRHLRIVREQESVQVPISAEKGLTDAELKRQLREKLPVTRRAVLNAEARRRGIPDRHGKKPAAAAADDDDEPLVDIPPPPPPPFVPPTAVSVLTDAELSREIRKPQTTDRRRLLTMEAKNRGLPDRHAKPAAKRLPIKPTKRPAAAADYEADEITDNTEEITDNDRWNGLRCTNPSDPATFETWSEIGPDADVVVLLRGDRPDVQEWLTDWHNKPDRSIATKRFLLRDIPAGVCIQRDNLRAWMAANTRGRTSYEDKSNPLRQVPVRDWISNGMLPKTDRHAVFVLEDTGRRTAASMDDLPIPASSSSSAAAASRRSRRIAYAAADSERPDVPIGEPIYFLRGIVDRDLIRRKATATK